MSDDDFDPVYRLAVPPADCALFHHEAELFWLRRQEGRTYLGSMSPFGLMGQHQILGSELNVEAWIQGSVTYQKYDIREAPYKPGEYHPRMCRGLWPGSPTDLPYRNSWRAAGIALRNVCDQLAKVFQVVEPGEVNGPAYGHDVRQVLLLACMEVEAAWRGVLEANDPSLPDRLTTNHYVRLKAPMRLDEWRLRLSLYDDWPEIVPYQHWSADNPSTSLPWYSAYNQTKHNREEHLDQASLKNVIDAVAALHVMMWAQFGEGTMAAFGLPALASFKIVQRPKWPPSELYFGGEDTTPRPRMFWPGT